MDQCNISENSLRDVWNIFGYSIPKMEVVFFSQIIALYMVIITCLINLSIGNKGTELWVSLLSASIIPALKLVLNFMTTKRQLTY